MSVNPFSYGRPIDDVNRFVGRRREIEQVYSRILSACESTSIVGESRAGKTSLLKAIAYPTTQASFGIQPGEYAFIYQDFQFLDSNTTPTRFWKRVLRSIKRAIKDHEEVVEEIDIALKAETIDNYTLDDIFTLVDDENLHIILLLDEFEQVTRNQQFDSDFFGGLRALAIHHNIALVTSSRQDLVELTHSNEVRSSPFFNIFATINLRAFSESEATELIDGYLQNTEVKFLLSELNMVFALAGYHPYFLQMTGHHLFAAYEEGLDDARRPQYLMNQVREEAAPIFQNYWNNSTPSQQILLIVIMMLELEKGKHQTMAELEKYYNRAPQVITELERRILISPNPADSTYHLFSTELREWIAEEIVGSVDDLRAWRDWQKDETMVGNLPSSLQDLLAQVVRGLNPAYREILGNFLLDPNTARSAISLVQHFVSRYEQYKETRAERDPSSSMAGVELPVGDAPKGLFARVSQQLTAREQGQPPAAKPRQPAKPKITETQSPDLPTAVRTGRSQRRVIGGSQSGTSPIALSSLVISNIVTELSLNQEDEAFVKDELKWLFYATDHFLKVVRGQIEATEPVAIAIPDDTERTAEANNYLLKQFDQPTLQSWQEQIESFVERIKHLLKNLDSLLDQKVTGLGIDIEDKIRLDNKLAEVRVGICQTMSRLAELIEEVYGIFVSSPEQLINLVGN